MRTRETGVVEDADRRRRKAHKRRKRKMRTHIRTIVRKIRVEKSGQKEAKREGIWAPERRRKRSKV
jgi:hypothetical protein